MYHILLLLSSQFLIRSQCSIRYFENEKHTHASPAILSYVYSTECSKRSSSSFSLVTFINSSSGIHLLMFRIDCRSAARIDGNSFLWSTDCRIEVIQKNSTSAFICEGEIEIERVNVASEYCLSSIIDLSSSVNCIPDISLSAVEVKLSYFRYLKVKSSGGELISRRGIKRERVIGSLFLNVSVGEEEEENMGRKVIRREESYIRDSLIERVERGMYGLIGAMERERGGGSFIFASSHNSFFLFCFLFRG